MDSKMTVEVGGHRLRTTDSSGRGAGEVARVSVGGAGMAHQSTHGRGRVVAHQRVRGDRAGGAVVFVEQLADFDAWRVGGGGVAFRW